MRYALSICSWVSFKKVRVQWNNSRDSIHPERPLKHCFLKNIFVVSFDSKKKRGGLTNNIIQHNFPVNWGRKAKPGKRKTPDKNYFV